MKKIYGWLQDGKYPNCSTLAADLEVGQRTVARDLDFMRDRWKLPIEYDDKRHGFYFTESVDHFPGVSMTEKEMVALFVASKSVEQYQGTPFHQPLKVAFQKLTGQLDDQERFTLESFGETLSFRPLAPDAADLREFELVTRATMERRGLKFLYRKPGEKKAHPRRVQPYHVMEFSNRWYLLGYDLDRKDIRKFVLGRMQEVALTTEKFEKPKEFDHKKYFDGSLGVMTGKGDFEVVIEMDAWLTDILRGRRWHPSQVWTEDPGGASQLRLHLNSLEEIEQYVLSWGEHATVVGPGELILRVARTARAVAARYAGVGG